MQNIEAKIEADTVLFFDMDGTLINTNLANFLSYKKAIHTVTKSEHSLINNSDGRFNRSNLKNAVPNLSGSEYQRIIQEKEKFYRDFLSETKLNEVIANILLKYSKTNRTVLVTNCRKDRAMETLNHFGLIERFSDIFYPQFNDRDEKINKYKNAISYLGIPVNSILVFENEKEEIEDAIIAGIPTTNILSL
jgi:phosphoglycolate phosphatase-like HAD superfamily hydrolase